MKYRSNGIWKQYAKGVFSLIVYLGIILAVTFWATSARKAKGDGGRADVELAGTIGQYPIEMSLHLADVDDDECGVTGEYRYTASGGGMLSLRGEREGESLVLKEYNDKGELTGTFDGTCSVGSVFEYAGTFTNYKGTSFEFRVSSE